MNSSPSSNKNDNDNDNDNDSSITGFAMIQGDRDEDLAQQQRQHDAASEILTAIGGMLQGAERKLSHLERDAELLPTAILRKCHELADGIGSVAHSLEEQSPDEQRALAQACVQDFPQVEVEVEVDATSSSVSSRRAGQTTKSDAIHSLALQSNHTSDGSDTSSTGIQQEMISPVPTEEEFLQVIQGTATVLRDIEAAFRDLSETDAEDIADATLTLARLFLISLQNVHETMTPHDLIVSESTSTSTSRSGVVIEELELDDEGDENNKSSSDDDNHHQTSRRKSARRTRVLWPRLGPHVAQALGWGKDAATQRPILAVALGLTLWPAAILTTCVGGSLVFCDHVIQDVYEHFQDGPLVSNLEQGASQLWQTAKLSFVLSSVVGKQTWRVVQRQVKRRGGVEPILHSVTEAALERATHPIETVGMAWNGLAWGVSTVTDTVQQILQQREELLATQELQ